MKSAFAIAFGLMLSLSGQECALAADTVEETLQDESYPWYDSVNRQFQPVDIPRMSRSDDFSLFGAEFFAVLLRILMWSLVIIVVIGLIMLLFRAFYDLEPTTPEAREYAPVVTQEQLAALPEMARGVTDFLAEARKLAATEQYSQAMIFYYAWQLVTLGNHEIIELKSGKTNRQYVRETARNQPSLKDLFRHSVRKFEDAIYGGFELSREEFQSLWQRRGQFREPAEKKSSFSKGTR